MKFKEKVKILNSLGQNIVAVIHRPKKSMGRLAILCPGYLDTKDYDHLVELAATLSKDGYTVVRFDPTGTWESEGEISDHTISQYLKDIRSVLEYMLQEDEYGSILLGGHSRGGMVSILYAARDSRISIVMGIMPSSSLSIEKKSLDDWKKTGVRISKRDVPGSTEMREFRVPFSHAVDGRQFDALKDVKKITVPVILIAGELDTIILPDSVQHIFDEAKDPRKFILLNGIGHDYRHNPAEIKIVNDKIVKSLKSFPNY
ncbi:MAG: alpha/beta fold hydrolase [Candidatus Taylorbacteria bacterium]